MTTPEPDAPATTPRRASALMGLVAVLALLVPAGIGIAVGVSILGSAPNVEAQPTPSSSSESTATPTAEPEAVVTPIDFASPSGNLRCHIDADAAYCHQGSIKYAAPADNCSVDGVAVGVTAEKTYWPCLSARPALAASVAYDVPVVNGEFTCVINLATGVRCINAAGNGFTMEVSAGVSTL